MRIGPRWARQGWARDRWLFAAVCLFGPLCAVSTVVGGVVLLVVDPPPVSVWILAAAYGLVQLWCWRISGGEPVESDELGEAGWEFVSEPELAATD
ncbi:hypothetical protein [Mycolicibacterium sp. CBMA 226]|uniref:hypothetical protein n=1 Tax=Mycolicibacterium sp. CBMA 226 TaxID=2606611 RepID=UPI0012DD1CA3|nr:hypothetical protein [Mycolicibacterium sp. CBMA 226]MUL78770.1 hypothetical protein [Mycolicibacterium sp. CBMA 226]